MMAMTALGYLIAWGPFAALCMWEMVTKPRVSRGNTSDVSFNMKTNIMSLSRLFISIYKRSFQLKDYNINVLGHSRDLPSGGLPVCQVRHCLQSLHLLLHVQGLQKGHRDCVQKVLLELEMSWKWTTCFQIMSELRRWSRQQQLQYREKQFLQNWRYIIFIQSVNQWS